MHRWKSQWLHSAHATHLVSIAQPEFFSRVNRRPRTEEILFVTAHRLRVEKPVSKQASERDIVRSTPLTSGVRA